MHPVIFQSGSFTIYTYGVLAAAGFLLGLLYAHSQARRAGIDPGKIWDLGVYGILVALLTSKVWLILSDWSFYAAHPRENVQRRHASIRRNVLRRSPGRHGLGAFLFAPSTSCLFCAFSTSDRRAFGAWDMPLDAWGAFGRDVATANRRRCPGASRSRIPWPPGLSGTPLNTPLHPTQLGESGAEFLNFILLVWFAAKKRLPGQVVGLYFMLYGAERGLLEFLRDDPGRTLLFQDRISLMQIVSVALVVLGAYLWLHAPRTEAQSGASTRSSGARPGKSARAAVQSPPSRAMRIPITRVPLADHLLSERAEIKRLPRPGRRACRPLFGFGASTSEPFAHSIAHR